MLGPLGSHIILRSKSLQNLFLKIGPLFNLLSAIGFMQFDLLLYTWHEWGTVEAEQYSYLKRFISPTFPGPAVQQTHLAGCL